jgi:hypothetical protein
MVFKDEHVNTAIDKAAAQGLRMFVIDPRGARIAYEMNETRKRNQISAGDAPLEQLLQRSLIGASRRSLREIFGNDETEHNKVMRLFNRP